MFVEKLGEMPTWTGNKFNGRPVTIGNVKKKRSGLDRSRLQASSPRRWRMEVKVCTLRAVREHHGIKENVAAYTCVLRTLASM